MKKFIEWIKVNESFLNQVATGLGAAAGLTANTLQGSNNDWIDAYQGQRVGRGQRTVGGIKNTIVNPLKYGACGGKSCSRGSAPSYNFDDVDTSQGHQQLVNIKEAAVLIEQNTYDRLVEERKLQSSIKSLSQELALHVHIQGDPATIGGIEPLIQKIYAELKIDPSVKYEPNAIIVGQQLVKNKKSGITINIPATKAKSSRPNTVAQGSGDGAARMRSRLMASRPSFRR